MPTFVFRARDKSGALVSGELDGASEGIVKEAIAAKGLFPVSVQGKGVQLDAKSLFSRKASAKDVANMTRQFQVMFAAGTPMDRILSILARQLKNADLKRTMTNIQKEVAGGTRLSVAFRGYPHYFGPLYCSMMEVGESGGVLDKTLREMASILQKESEIHAKVKSATLYPKIVLFVLGAVTWAMMVFVIPPFKTFYASHNADLPTPTKVVMGLSDLFTSYWYVPIIVGAACYWLWKRFARTELGQKWIGTVAFRLPVFGKLNRLIANARFGHLVASLYRAGVPIAHALGVVANTMTNVRYAEEVRSIKRGLEQGYSLSKCMETTKHFEPMVQEAIAVGEKTGQLDALLDSTATFYDGEIDEILKNMATLIEPILLVFLFAGVTVLALAIYLPIWNLSKVMLPK